MPPRKPLETPIPESAPPEPLPTPIAPTTKLEPSPSAQTKVDVPKVRTPLPSPLVKTPKVREPLPTPIAAPFIDPPKTTRVETEPSLNDITSPESVAGLKDAVGQQWGEFKQGAKDLGTETVEAAKDIGRGVAAAGQKVGKWAQGFSSRLGDVFGSTDSKAKPGSPEAFNDAPPKPGKLVGWSERGVEMPLPKELDEAEAMVRQNYGDDIEAARSKLRDARDKYAKSDAPDKAQMTYALDRVERRLARPKADPGKPLSPERMSEIHEETAHAIRDRLGEERAKTETQQTLASIKDTDPNAEGRRNYLRGVLSKLNAPVPEMKPLAVETPTYDKTDSRDAVRAHLEGGGSVQYVDAKGNRHRVADIRKDGAIETDDGRALGVGPRPQFELYKQDKSAPEPEQSVASVGSHVVVDGKAYKVDSLTRTGAIGIDDQGRRLRIPKAKLETAIHEDADEPTKTDKPDADIAPNLSKSTVANAQQSATIAILDNAKTLIGKNGYGQSDYDLLAQDLKTTGLTGFLRKYNIEDFSPEVQAAVKKATDAVSKRNQSPAFHHWFGKEPGHSSVVRSDYGDKGRGASGEPVTVYHGTARGGHTVFDPEKSSGDNLYGPGAGYFTENEDAAESYQGKGAEPWRFKNGARAGYDEAHAANDRAAKEGRITSEQKVANEAAMKRLWHEVPQAKWPEKIAEMLPPEDIGSVLEKTTPINPSRYEANLNIRRPFDMDKKLTPEAARSIVDRALRGIDTKKANRLREQIKDATDPMPGEIIDPNRTYSGDHVWQSIANATNKSTANKLLKRAGYDGITHMGGGRVGKGEVMHRVWIPFESNQVKSITNENPTTDSPDINANKSGPLATPLGGLGPKAEDILRKMADAHQRMTAAKEAGEYGPEQRAKRDYYAARDAIGLDDALDKNLTKAKSVDDFMSAAEKLAAKNPSVRSAFESLEKRKPATDEPQPEGVPAEQHADLPSVAQTEHHEAIRKILHAGLGEGDDKHAATIDKTLSQMAPAFAEHAAAGLKSVKWHADLPALGEHVGAQSKKIKAALDEGAELGGAFNKNTGELHVDGPMVRGKQAADEVLTHELGHAAIKSNPKLLEGAEEAAKADKRRLLDAGFKYATESTEECICESLRIASKIGPEKFKELAPNMASFLGEHGMLRDVPKPTEATDIFDKPIDDGPQHADTLKKEEGGDIRATTASESGIGTHTENALSELVRRYRSSSLPGGSKEYRDLFRELIPQNQNAVAIELRSVLQETHGMPVDEAMAKIGKFIEANPGVARVLAKYKPGGEGRREDAVDPAIAASRRAHEATMDTNHEGAIGLSAGALQNAEGNGDTAAESHLDVAMKHDEIANRREQSMSPNDYDRVIARQHRTAQRAHEEAAKRHNDELHFKEPRTDVNHAQVEARRMTDLASSIGPASSLAQQAMTADPDEAVKLHSEVIEEHKKEIEILKKELPDAVIAERQPIDDESDEVMEVQQTPEDIKTEIRKHEDAINANRQAIKQLHDWDIRANLTEKEPLPSPLTEPEPHPMHAPVTKVRRLGGGITDTHLVTMENGKKGVWKQAGNQPTLREHIPAETYHRRETAASDVAKVLGLGDLVPETVTRSLDDGKHVKGAHFGNQEGSVQEFHPGTSLARELVNPFDGEKDHLRSAAFDYVIGQTDRHPSNWLLTEKPGTMEAFKKTVNRTGERVADFLHNVNNRWTRDFSGFDREGDKIKLIDNALSLPTKEIGRHMQSSDFIRAAEKHKVPADLATWAGKWPEIQTALKRNKIEPQAIALAKQRFDAIVKASKEGATFGELPHAERTVRESLRDNPNHWRPRRWYAAKKSAEPVVDQNAATVPQRDTPPKEIQ